MKHPKKPNQPEKRSKTLNTRFKSSLTILMICLNCFVTSELLANSPAHSSSLASITPNEINPTVFKLAKKAFLSAKKQGISTKNDLITIIDYSLPSSAKRLWVVNLDNDRILYNLLVAQGSRSGWLYATHFSNVNQSHKSSLGLFRTGKTYYGHDGYSLRLHGLEKGFNDHAFNRHIVMHGANYVSQDFIKVHHRLGRSWGCPAVNPRYAKSLINLIKDNSMVFAYAPQKNWLAHSKFLS